MKAIIAAVLALASFCAGAQQIRVFHVFTGEASILLGILGLTEAQFVAESVTAANKIYTDSGVTAQIVSSGYQVGGCCGDQTHFYRLDDTDIGAVQWAKGHLPIAQARDATNADMVVVFGDYTRGENPPNDMAGVTGGLCSGALGRFVTPQNALVGVNVWPQAFSDAGVVYAHEVAHMLCMEHSQVYSKKTGSTPSDCSVRWTIEGGDAGSTDIDYPSYTAACWQVLSYNNGCYPNGHAAIDSIPDSLHPRAYDCSFSLGALQNGGVKWSEWMSCAPPYNVAASYSAGLGGTTTYPGFRCTNWRVLRYFSGPTIVNGENINVPNASAPKMNAQAPILATFRNTKLAPPMLNNILGAVGVAQ